MKEYIVVFEKNDHIIAAIHHVPEFVLRQIVSGYIKAGAKHSGNIRNNNFKYEDTLVYWIKEGTAQA